MSITMEDMMFFKNFYMIRLSLIMLISLFVAGCFLDEENLEFVFADNVVVIESDITVPTTWDSTKVYYIGYRMGVTASLTIPAGTVIKFGREGGIDIDATGTINAVGTIGQPIIFTSVKDDRFGGDSILDGVTSGTRGDWGQLWFSYVNGSTLSYCQFHFGGNAGTVSESVINLFGGSNVSITNCLFAFNTGSGSDMTGALEANGAGSGTVITGNRFYGNILPLSINSDMSLDDSNNFSSVETDPGTGEPLFINTYNGVFIEVDNGIGTVAWRETEVALVPVSNSTVMVNDNETLTIGTNVVMKFLDSAHFEYDNGNGASISYTGGTVDFTSYKDDSLLGDTNGNGAASAPDAVNGNWDGVWRWNSGSAEWERTFVTDCHYLCPLP